RLAISAAAPAFSATTYLLLTVARRLIVPSLLVMRAKVSHEPTAARLAISGSAPAFSAQTYMLLARDRRATLPPPRSIRSKRSVAPMVVALASKEPLALTYLPLT